MAAVYLTLSDLEQTIGAAQVLSLLDKDNDGVADDDVVDRVLTSAERFVAARVSGRYSMATLLADPAATDHLRSIAVNVAVQMAYQTRTEFTTREGTPYQGAYNEAVKSLADIRIDVDGAGGTPGNVGGSITYPVVPLDDSVFTAGAFSGGFGDF